MLPDGAPRSPRLPSVSDDSPSKRNTKVFNTHVFQKFAIEAAPGSWGAGSRCTLVTSADAIRELPRARSIFRRASFRQVRVENRFSAAASKIFASVSYRADSRAASHCVSVPPFSLISFSPNIYKISTIIIIFCLINHLFLTAEFEVIREIISGLCISANGRGFVRKQTCFFPSLRESRSKPPSTVVPCSLNKTCRLV